MTVDQINTILNLPDRSVERFSYACAVLGINIEKSGAAGHFIIPAKDRSESQQRGIARVLQEALGAIDDWGINGTTNTLVVWL